MSHPNRTDARLARSLHALAAIEAEAKTPARVEAAVMARWDAARGVRTRSRAVRLVRTATTAAAGLTVGGLLGWPDNRSLLHPDAERGAQPGYTTVAVVGGPLMAGEPIRIVRMRVARSVLGDLGLPSPAVQPRAEASQIDTVDIDVLVGEDGVARGVRVPTSAL